MTSIVSGSCEGFPAQYNGGVGCGENAAGFLPLIGWCGSSSAAFAKDGIRFPLLAKRKKLFSDYAEELDMEKLGLQRSLVAGAGSNLHLLPEQVKLVAGTGVDHNLQSTPVKMVAGGRNHHYLRLSGPRHLPIDAAPDAEETVAERGSFLSVLFRTAA